MQQQSAHNSAPNASPPPSSMVSSVLPEGVGAVPKSERGFAANDPNGTADTAIVEALKFNPQLEDRHANKRSEAASKAGLNFNLSSFVEYYPLFRMLGYTAEASISYFNKTPEQRKDPTVKVDKSMAAEVRGLEKAIVSRHPIKGMKNWIVEKNRAGELGHSIAKVEAPLFLGLAATFGIKSSKDLKEDAKLAVAAERGQNPEETGFSDIIHSRNPIVASATDRFFWQQGFRHAAAASFAVNTYAGIMANALLITQERTFFNRPIAYDILKSSVLDVQINNLGKEAQPDLVDNLIRTIQASRLDHRRNLLEKHDVDALRPLINRIAEDIIDKRFGFAGALYIMGGGVIVPGNPELSTSNYEHVRTVGVSGVANEGQWLRHKNGSIASKAWDLGHRTRKDMEGYVAESATEEALLKYRTDVHARPGAMAAIG